MATAEDDGIEILSCHIEHEEEGADNSASVTVKVANGDVSDDPVTKQRKRVARAVGIVTFILLLFSVVLIGVSLNMSKNIDEMVRQANEKMPRRQGYGGRQNKPSKPNATTYTHQSPL